MPISTNSKLCSRDSPCTGAFTKNTRSYKEKGARGVIVIVIGKGHGDTSSNPGQD